MEQRYRFQIVLMYSQMSKNMQCCSTYQHGPLFSADQLRPVYAVAKEHRLDINVETSKTLEHGTGSLQGADN